VEQLIVDLKRGKPHWGARKIRELLVRRLAGDVRIPAKSTVHAVLDRYDLVKRARQRRGRAEGTPLSHAAQSNDLWCTDFKGEFTLGNGRYCYPLTVSDQASRYLLACEALESTKEAPSSKPLSACSGNVACRRRSAPTTGYPSPAPTDSTISPGYRSGG
jgi:transposase InsO family protein